IESLTIPPPTTRLNSCKSVIILSLFKTFISESFCAFLEVEVTLLLEFDFEFVFFKISDSKNEFQTPQFGQRPVHFGCSNLHSEHMYTILLFKFTSKIKTKVNQLYHFTYISTTSLPFKILCFI